MLPTVSIPTYDRSTYQISVPADLQEKALLNGDLAKLTPQERLSYYNAVCESLGLNPLTRPFEYLVLNNKLTLYARKDCTEQLRANRTISIQIKSREVVEGVYAVTAQATQHQAGGQIMRTDEAIGAVSIQGLNGEAKANALMKAETKAKRRVTLSICGLGMLDETEIETIPGATVAVMPTAKPQPVRVPDAVVTDVDPSLAASVEPLQADDAAPYLVKVGRQKNESVLVQTDENLAWVLGYYQNKIQQQPDSRFRSEWEEAVLALEAETAARRSYAQTEVE